MSPTASMVTAAVAATGPAAEDDGVGVELLAAGEAAPPGVTVGAAAGPAVPVGFRPCGGVVDVRHG
jgi:hypothetical protein